jgi:hypothetical protein
VEHIVQTLALTLGVGWASGLNLYAAILVLGFLGATGEIVLPPGLEVLTHPLVMLAAGGMYLVEFFADKVPGVDTAWDGLQTFVRIPAGAILAAQAVGDLGAGPELAAALVGGGLAAGSHAVKAGSRVLINTSPEPFSNWAASIGEDVSVLLGLWTALHHPVIFLVALALFVLLSVWLLPRIWRGIKKVFGWLGRWSSARGAAPVPTSNRPTDPPDRA